MVEKEITRRAMIHLLSVLAKWRLAVQVIVEQGEIDKVIIPPLFMFKLLYELYCHPEKGPKKRHKRKKCLLNCHPEVPLNDILKITNRNLGGARGHLSRYVICVVDEDEHCQKG